MTSLSPFLQGTRTSGVRKVETLDRIISMLLQGIVRYSFESDSSPTAEFQTSMRKVRSDFDTVEDEDSALMLAGTAIRLMDSHNEAAQQQVRARQNELEASIAILSEALLEVSRVGAETMVNFKEIERDLAAAPDINALREARAKLARAVGTLRDDIANPLKKCGIPGGEIDTATGLPDYGFAAHALAEIWHRRDDCFAAIFAAERLETINMRFGFQAGDQVLLLLSQHVARVLAPGDQLYRWRGPCVVALLKRKAPEAMIASDLGRHTLAKMEHAITLGDREVMLSVSSSWNLFPLKSADRIEELLSRMNAFAANRAVLNQAVGAGPSPAKAVSGTKAMAAMLNSTV